jgi:hypothetical protein
MVWGSHNANRRSQVAVEYLVIMAFVLLILLGLISLNQGLLDSFGGQFRASKARIAIDDLADAADSVYIQGVGAQTRVFISLPKGINTTLISNHTLLLSLNAPDSGRNDIYRNLNFPVNGFLPREEGNYWITVRAMPGYVLIGYTLIEVTPSGISLTLGPGNSSFVTLLIRNVIDLPVGVSLSYSVDPEFNLTLNQSSLLLNTNSTQAVLATISVPLLADDDTHTGTITLIANTTTESQTVTLPITVIIVGTSCEACICSPIQLYPDLWDLGNISRYRLFQNTFYLCNNLDTAQTVSLNFSLTSYIGFDPGTSTKTSSVPVGGKTCSAFQVYVNTTSSIPASYSTLLLATAPNGSDASTILFNILNITSVPIVNLMTPTNNFTSSLRDITFRYNVSSNFTLYSCGLLISGRLNKTDYDVPINIRDEFNVTGFPDGTYNWTINCTDENGGAGIAAQRTLVVRVRSLYAVPDSMWEEDFDPTWSTEVQRAYEGVFATIMDEGAVLPDWTEYEFPSLGVTDINTIRSITFTFRHFENPEGGNFDDPDRHTILCYDGGSWIYQTLYPNVTSWTFYTTPNMISCLTSAAVANDFHVRVNYDPAFDFGSIQYVDFAQIELNLTDVYYPFLWPRAIDPWHPVDFTSGLNTTANTFGWNAGDDGWDWSRNIYGGPTNATAFNADPNMDGNIADSTVAADHLIKITLGGGTPGAPATPNDAGISGPISSGAYGVQFNITPDMYSLISSGGKANLSFGWNADIHAGSSALGAGDEIWVKARLTAPGNLTTWLGSSQDSACSDKDASNEIGFRCSAADISGTPNLDITSLISSAGSYYLDLGGMIGGWGSANERLAITFDNVQILIK